MTGAANRSFHWAQCCVLTMPYLPCPRRKGLPSGFLHSLIESHCLRTPAQQHSLDHCQHQTGSQAGRQDVVVILCGSSCMMPTSLVQVEVEQKAETCKRATRLFHQAVSTTSTTSFEASHISSGMLLQSQYVTSPCGWWRCKVGSDLLCVTERLSKVNFAGGHTGHKESQSSNCYYYPCPSWYTQ